MSNLDITRMKKAGKYYIYLLRWILISTLLGIIGGIVGSAFHLCLEKVTHLRGEYTWLLFLLPFLGLLIVFLYKCAGFDKDPGTDLVLSSTQSEDTIPFRMFPLIFVTSVLTHLGGGSAGREGASLQIGGSLGAKLGSVLKLNNRDKRITIMCGMSAVFSAMFGTPIAAAIFCIEVTVVGSVQYAALVPCVISAVIAEYVSNLLGITESVYAVNLQYDVTAPLILKIVIIGVLCGILSRLFCKLMHAVKHLLVKYMPNGYIRAFVGGIIIVALTIVLRTTDFNGAGTTLIEKSFVGEVVWYAFLVKLLFTAITLGAGFKGGEIVPALCVGATFGCVMASVFGIPVAIASTASMIACFCGVTNAPLASLVLAIELFGTSDIIFFAIICAISYACSGYESLYASQTIVQDKLYQRDIFRKAK